MSEETKYPLSECDKIEFEKLKQTFAKKQSSVKEDRHVASFSQEIQAIINFVDRRIDGREVRAINAGFTFNGVFICINTRILKNFISRCKSSINSSLQQLGYTSLKTKAKAQECLFAAIPCLANDPEYARQWTVRFSISRRCYPFFTNAFPRFMFTQQIQAQQKPKAPPPMKPPKLPPMPIIKRAPAPLVVPMVNLPIKLEETHPVEIVDEEIHLDYHLSYGEDDIFSSVYQMEWDFSIPF